MIWRTNHKQHNRTRIDKGEFLTQSQTPIRIPIIKINVFNNADKLVGLCESFRFFLAIFLIFPGECFRMSKNLTIFQSGNKFPRDKRVTESECISLELLSVGARVVRLARTRCDPLRPLPAPAATRYYQYGQAYQLTCYLFWRKRVYYYKRIIYRTNHNFLYPDFVVFMYAIVIIFCE